MDSTCRLCAEPCNSNERLIDRNFREKAQDIFVLQINIAKKYNPTVCDSCQSQVERFYLFKRKCRQQEELRRNPKATVLSTGFAVKDGEVVEPVAESEKAIETPAEPEGKVEEEQTKKKVAKPRRRNRGRPVRPLVRFTKEELATKTRAELYKERYNKVCELCGKSVASREMEVHMNQHRGLRPYACDVLGCEAKFHGLDALKGHVKRSHSDGQFPCPECDKVLTNEASLATHRRTHREKQFTCEICGLKCRLRSCLKKHMLIHTQQRDYKCEFCGKAYYSNQVLQLHVRSHTGERPYACHVCDFSHAHRILYVKHMQKAHPGEEIRTLAEMQRLAAIARAQQKEQNEGEATGQMEEGNGEHSVVMYKIEALEGMEQF